MYLLYLYRDIALKILFKQNLTKCIILILNKEYKHVL